MIEQEEGNRPSMEGRESGEQTGVARPEVGGVAVRLRALPRSARQGERARVRPSIGPSGGGTGPVLGRAGTR
ncbi:MAG: hypothetical protein ACREDK_02105 [Thermoplasmata archaeon]